MLTNLKKNQFVLLIVAGVVLILAIFKIFGFEDNSVELVYEKDISIEYDYANIEGHYLALMPVHIDKKLYFYALNVIDSCLDIISYEKRKRIKSIDLKEIIKKQDISINGRQLVTDEFKIFVFSEDKGSIIELDTVGDIVNSFNINEVINYNKQHIENSYDTVFYFSTTYMDFPLYWDNHIFLQRLYPFDRSVIKFKSYKEAIDYEYNHPHEFIIKIDNDKIDAVSVGIAPKIYREGFYDVDRHVYRCIDNQGRIYFGRSSSDSVYIYDFLGFNGAFSIKSKYDNVKPKSLENEKIFSGIHERDYLVTKANYSGIYYDKFQDVFLRQFYGSLKKSKGKYKEQFIDKPYSIILYKKGTGKIGEVNMKREYSYMPIIPIEEGILIIKSNEDSDYRLQTGNIVLSFFRYKKNR